MKFGDFAFAAAMRDFIRDEVRSQVNKLRPTAREAVVVTIDPSSYTATVQFLDEPDGDAIPVRMSGVQPATPGQVVRIEGPRGDRYIAAVYGETNISGGASSSVLYVNSNTLFANIGEPTVEVMPASWIGATVTVDAAYGIGWDNTGCPVTYSGTIEDPPGSGIYVTPPDELVPWLPDSRWEMPLIAATIDEGVPLPIMTATPTYADFYALDRTMSSFNYLSFGEITIEDRYLFLWTGISESSPPVQVDFPEPTYPDASPSLPMFPSPIGLFRLTRVG